MVRGQLGQGLLSKHSLLFCPLAVYELLLCIINPAWQVVLVWGQRYRAGCAIVWLSVPET